ncbi:unnamed protein product [Mesocestoides corti]|uniref:Uncharacterized protein n=1 Tax=Mesocestoides corti TaxID=53468 RepID=A0A158QV36_MESCO|nr:unnamed protein product [Mesocestoides corti]
MIDDKLNESEPGTIHVFQVISGYNGNQMFVPFLKSLIINHFFTRKSSDPAAEPIHLHLVTDTKSRLELEGILASWRITDFLYTFYAIEPLQTEGYNGGLVLWYASRAPQEKWDAIWKPVFANFDKPKIFLPAAEQTVMTLTAILNPEIFYALDCTWNLQLSFDCKPYNCLSKWTSSDPNAPKPKVMHGSGAGKQFGKFALEKPKHPLIIDTLHSTGKFLTASELCKMNWRMLTKLCELNEEFSYTTERIIYPIYICPDFERMSFHTDGITLVMGLEITQLDTLEQAIVQWEGRISVALEATTAEAFRFIEAHKKSSILSRQNIRYHFVLQNQTMQTESVLHNTAVAYSITNRVLIPIGDDADLGEIFEVLQLVSSTCLNAIVTIAR